MSDVTFRNDGPWGAGKGSRLTSLELDNNFWTLVQQIEDMLATGGTGATGKLIVSTEYAGNTFTFNYSDATSDIVPLPVAYLNFPAVPWANNTAYAYLDVVTVPPLGIYVALRAHTSPPAPAIFDPDAVDGLGNPLWQLLIPLADTDYDVAAFVPGIVQRAAGEPLLQFILDRPVRMEVNLDDRGFAYLGTAIEESTGAVDIVLAIKKQTGGSASEIGSITFEPGNPDSAGGQAGVIDFPAQVDFIAGDLLIIDATASNDPAAADLSVTLPALRMDVPGT